MKYIKLLLLIITFLVSFTANAWRKEGNYIIIEKGDNLSSIAHSLFARGILYDSLWKNRIDFLSNNPNLIYEGMRIRLDSLMPEKNNEEKFSEPNIINNEGKSDDKQTNDRCNGWCFFLELVSDLCKIALFPAIALLLTNLLSPKNSFRVKDYLIMLAIIYAALLLWTFINNFHWNINYNTGSSLAKITPDTIILKTTNSLQPFTGNTFHHDSISRSPIPYQQNKTVYNIFSGQKEKESYFISLLRNLIPFFIAIITAFLLWIGQYIDRKCKRKTEIENQLRETFAECEQVLFSLKATAMDAAYEKSLREFWYYSYLKEEAKREETKSKETKKEATELINDFYNKYNISSQAASNYISQLKHKLAEYNKHLTKFNSLINKPIDNRKFKGLMNSLVFNDVPKLDIELQEEEAIRIVGENDEALRKEYLSLLVPLDQLNTEMENIINSLPRKKL